eukprot:GHVH01011175.1.p1 GENE.GHVH01011175.1~~GHVH01011175.1.p1  ORF type:complete len:927 (-),score=120.27 GHVH01011175.1:222-3002(-)
MHMPIEGDVLLFLNHISNEIFEKRCNLIASMSHSGHRRHRNDVSMFEIRTERTYVMTIHNDLGTLSVEERNLFPLRYSELFLRAPGTLIAILNTHGHMVREREFLQYCIGIASIRYALAGSSVPDRYKTFIEESASNLFNNISSGKFEGEQLLTYENYVTEIQQNHTLIALLGMEHWELKDFFDSGFLGDPVNDRRDHDRIRNSEHGRRHSSQHDSRYHLPSPSAILLATRPSKSTQSVENDVEELVFMLNGLANLVHSPLNKDFIRQHQTILGNFNSVIDRYKSIGGGQLDLTTMLDVDNSLRPNHNSLSVITPGEVDPSCASSRSVARTIVGYLFNERTYRHKSTTTINKPADREYNEGTQHLSSLSLSGGSQEDGELKRRIVWDLCVLEHLVTTLIGSAHRLGASSTTQQFTPESRELLTPNYTPMLEEGGIEPKFLGRDTRLKPDSNFDPRSSFETNMKIMDHRNSMIPQNIAQEAADSKKSNRRDERNYIFFGHPQWNLVLSMMSGIQFACRKVSWEPHRAVCFSDYRGPDKFPIRMSEEQKEYTMFYDFSPFVFRQIRRMFGWEDSAYVDSIGPNQLISALITGNFTTFSESASQGKSGSLFYTTSDNQLLIKTVSEKEAERLLVILKDYYHWLKMNPNTLVTKFFGLHAIRTMIENDSSSSAAVGGEGPKTRSLRKKVYFVVMENIFMLPHANHKVYDLKGSCIGRKADPGCHIHKDVDWLEHDEGIYLSAHKREKLISIVRKDSNFLQSLQILDYSLLIGMTFMSRVPSHTGSSFFPSESGARDCNMSDNELLQRTARMSGKLKRRENVNLPFHQQDGGALMAQDGSCLYTIGIIDILTFWKSRKKMEWGVKRLMHPHSGFSCVPPDEYALRFFRFAKNSVIKAIADTDYYQDQSQLNDDSMGTAFSMSGNDRCTART